MRYLRLLAAAALTLAWVSHVGAQGSKPAADVVVAPFVVESGNGDELGAVSASCSKQFIAALEKMEVTVAPDPRLSEENLRSARALFAVLGRVSHQEGQYRLELQLLDVKSGDELRSYFNSDKDPQVACRAVTKFADRIAAVVKEQRASQPKASKP